MSIAEKLTQIAENEQKVYDAGKKAEYDRFWDAYQANGKRVEYYFTFSGKGWTDETFRPKYDIHMRSSAIGAFEYNQVTDLVKSLNDSGVSMDTDGATNMQAIFAYAKTKTIPALNATKATSMTSAFESCRNLERIESLSVQKSTPYSSTTFKNCDALKHIVFEGEIGNDLNLSYSNSLSVDSMKSIISCLENYAGTGNEFAHTLNLTEDCWVALEADSLAPDGNTWREYVTDKLCWNV